MKSSENNAEAPEPKPTQNIDARLATSEDLASALTVLRGAPSPEELAAVIAVLQHAQSEAQSQGKPSHLEPKSTWVRNSNQLRSGLRPGAGQWQAAYRPGLE